MGMQLPGELIQLLGGLGFDWPEADETTLLEMGQVWIEFAGTLNRIVGAANDQAAGVWQDNTGADIEAFQNWWSGNAAPASSVQDGATAATLTGSGLAICGMVVLGLKIAVIVQLTLLAVEIAQAVATAAPTFGASLLEVPVFQQLTRTIVGSLIQEAAMQLIDA